MCTTYISINLAVWLLLPSTLPAAAVPALLFHVDRLVLVVAAVLTLLLLARCLVGEERGELLLLNLDDFFGQRLGVLQLHHLKEEMDCVNILMTFDQLPRQ